MYDEVVQNLKNSGYLIITDDSLVHLTEKGRAQVAFLPKYHFNGWDYRGNEMIFFDRLSLTVQTLSNFRLGEKLFLPTIKEIDIQKFVKNLLQKQSIDNPAFSNQIMEELLSCFNSKDLTEIHKIIFTHRLGGYRLTGWTWSQLAKSLKLNEESVRLLYIESLHLLLNAIETSKSSSFLKKLTQDIKVTSYLTASAMQTKQLFENGMSMEDIAAIRKLKLSTIEDHFVEMSINDSDFPLELFVSKNDAMAVIQKADELETRRLRLLKDVFNHLTYFQLRLILGFKSEGGVKWISVKS